MNIVWYALLRMSGNVLKLPSIILSCILLPVMSLTSFWFFGWNLGCYPSADQIDQYHVLGQIRRAMRRFWIWKKKSMGKTERTLSRGGTPLYSHIGMCRPIGGFSAVLVWKRVYTLPILVWNRVWFSRELRSVWTYLSFQFQMSKKERQIFEFEMDWLMSLFAL